MSDDLLKRLRGWARDIYEGSTATWAMDQDLKSAADRIEKLEAKLAKAVEALKLVVHAKGLTDPTEYGYEAIKFARTTIAELTGGKDDRNP